MVKQNTGISTSTVVIIAALAAGAFYLKNRSKEADFSNMLTPLEEPMPAPGSVDPNQIAAEIRRMVQDAIGNTGNMQDTDGTRSMEEEIRQTVSDEEVSPQSAEALAMAIKAPAVKSGDVSVEEATRAIVSVTTRGEAAVVGRALGYIPKPTAEEWRAMTPAESLAYQYGVDLETGELMSKMTAGELIRYNMAHGI